MENSSAMSTEVSSLPSLKVPLSNSAEPVVSRLQVTLAYSSQSFKQPRRTAQYLFPGLQPQIQLFATILQSYDEFDQHIQTAVRKSMLKVLNTSGVILAGDRTVIVTANQYGKTSRLNADASRVPSQAPLLDIEVGGTSNRSPLNRGFGGCRLPDSDPPTDRGDSKLNGEIDDRRKTDTLISRKYICTATFVALGFPKCKVEKYKRRQYMLIEI